MIESKTVADDGLMKPYRQSWIDYLIQGIKKFPGPSWVFYVCVLLLFAVLNNVVFWLGSDTAPGTFHPLFTFAAVYVIYGIGFYHYLSGVAGKSLHDFLPILGGEAETEKALVYSLSHLPAGWGWLALVFGMVGGYFDSTSSQTQMQLNSSLITVYSVVVSSFNYATFFAMVFLTARQLNIVITLHRKVAEIDLFNLAPLRAFSRLTATAGFAILFLGAFSALVFVDDSDPSLFAFYFGMVLLGIIIFIMPLMSMRARIRKEKKQKLLDTDQDIRHTLDEVRRFMQTDDLTRMGEFHTTLNVLEKERGIIKGISSYPWDPGTFKSFFSTILIPILIWLIRTIIERWL